MKAPMFKYIFKFLIMLCRHPILKSKGNRSHSPQFRSCWLSEKKIKMNFSKDNYDYFMFLRLMLFLLNLLFALGLIFLGLLKRQSCIIVSLLLQELGSLLQLVHEQGGRHLKLLEVPQNLELMVQGLFFIDWLFLLLLFNCLLLVLGREEIVVGLLARLDHSELLFLPIFLDILTELLFLLLLRNGGSLGLQVLDVADKKVTKVYAKNSYFK